MPRYVLRPTSDVQAAWTETPASTAFTALDEAVEQPTVPTTTDYISTSTNSAICRLGTAGPALESNEEVVAVKAWIYGKVASNSTRVEVYSNSTVLATANQTSTSDAWFSTTYTGSLTQAQVDDLQINIVVQGAVLHTVYAAYLEVFTRSVEYPDGTFYFGYNPGGAPEYSIGVEDDLLLFDNYRISVNIDDLDNTYETTADIMDFFGTLGIKPLVGMLFDNRIPTEAECESLDGFCDTYADQILAIEFGNENGFSYQSTSYTQGAEYAASAVIASGAIAGRVPFLIQGDNFTPNFWRDDILAAVPNIEDYIDGWTIHRYQSDWATHINALRDATSKPIWVTEMGFSSDNGNTLASNYSGQPVNMTYATAATKAQEFYDAMKAEPRVQALFMFGAYDLAAHGASTDFQNYFGGLTSTFAAKGAYTDKLNELIEADRTWQAEQLVTTGRKYYGASGFTTNAYRIRRTSDWKLIDAAADTTAPVSPIPEGWTRFFRADVKEDWNQVLNDYSPSTDAAVTNETGYVKYVANTGATPVGGTGRGRIETQATGTKGLVPGDEGIYTWDFYIPSAVVLPTNSPDDYTTINQFHGNNQAGYTGGMRVHKTDNALQLQVEGGTRIDSNNYESEEQLDLGTLTRDTWTTIHYHVKWDVTSVDDGPTGFAIAYINNVKKDELTDIPTMGPEADHIMFRCGWYPASVPSPGLDLRVRNVEIWVP